MIAVFADTSYFLALLRAGDSLHTQALDLTRSRLRMITTEAIILEMGSACARAEDHTDFLSLIDGLRANRHVSITPLSTALLDRGMALMNERQDKDWSLTDCISFVVMRDEGIGEALTADHHFEQAGFVVLMPAPRS